jgi:hypothetical protein
MPILSKLPLFQKQARAGAWGAFARDWADASLRPAPSEWDKLRHVLRRAGPLSLAAEHREQAAAYEPLVAAFAASPEWLRAGVEACGFWCEQPTDHNLGWGVAQIEMAALGTIPEERQETRLRLSTWLANRRADEAEMAVAQAWGLSSGEWGDKMILSIVWQDPSRREALAPISDAQWLERSIRSARAFAAHGLLDPSDFESGLRQALRDPVNLRSATAEATTLLAFMAFDDASTRRILAAEDAGARWLASAGAALEQAKAQGEPQPVLEQAHAQVEALVLAASLAPVAPSGPPSLSDEAAFRAKPRAL